MSDAAAAFLLDRALRLRGVVVFVEIGDGDIGAFAGEENGDRAADAGIAAGDERDLVLELVRALVMRRVVHRREFKVGFVPGLLEMLLRKGRLRISRAPACIGLAFFAGFDFSLRSILRWIARCCCAVTSARASKCVFECAGALHVLILFAVQWNLPGAATLDPALLRIGSIEIRRRRGERFGGSPRPKRRLGLTIWPAIGTLVSRNSLSCDT